MPQVSANWQFFVFVGARIAVSLLEKTRFVSGKQFWLICVCLVDGASLEEVKLIFCLTWCVISAGNISLEDIKLMFWVNMRIVSAGNYRTLSEDVKLAVLICVSFQLVASLWGMPDILHNARPQKCDGVTYGKVDVFHNHKSETEQAPEHLCRFNTQGSY